MTNDEATRTNYLSGSPLEPLRGYARAVRLGESLWISGTTAMTSKGEVIAPNDAYEQTRYVLQTVRTILSTAGFRMEDVVRTRLFVTNISYWEDYAEAHREAFEKIRPASSMVQVTKLVDPRLTIEMEIEAVKGGRQAETVAL
jgi:enamine deaminase RidA (YjgF/YER057c/UK114 family)